MFIEPAVRSLTPAIVVALAPKAIEVDPTVTAELDNFALAIEPANCALVIVPTKDDVGYAVASDKSNAGVVSLAPNANETPPKFTVEFVNAEFGTLANAGPI